MSEKWPHFYILIGRLPVAVDLMTWAPWFENIENRRIGYTVLDDTPVERHAEFGPATARRVSPKCYVSTVCLGVNHSMHPDREPEIFETMIFGGPMDGETWRYSSYDAAERGHEEAVIAAKAAAAGIELIRAEAHKP